MVPRAEAYRLLMADVYELAGLSRRTSESVAAQFDQTVARWHLMSVLSGGPRTVAAAARRLGLTRQSVQRVADDLVAAGLATTTDNPDHARSPLLELTATGHETLARIVARSDVLRAQALARAGVTSEDLSKARTVLHDLLRALEEPSKAAGTQS